MSEKVIHISLDLLTQFLWLVVQFSPKPPGYGDSKVPEIKFHSWSLLRNDIVNVWF